MKEKLSKLLTNSYSPYSHVRVACIITMNDGNTFCGVNVENASFKEGLCAEQVAISAAITNGYKEQDFSSIALMGDTKTPIHPCFLCRQIISELFKETAVITCYNTQGDKEELTVKDLCTYTFSDSDFAEEGGK